MLSFSQLKKNLKKEDAQLKNIKISILSENAGQLVTIALKGYGVEFGYNFEINECGYNELNLQVFEPESQLYSVQSDYIIIVPSVQKLLNQFYKKPIQERNAFSREHISHMEEIIHTISSKSNAKIILFNYLEINDGVFGNFSAKLDISFITQLRKINIAISELAQTTKNLFINDIVSLQTQFGTAFIIDSKFYINSDIAFSLDFLPHLAKNTLDIIKSIEGKINKCLILDLDNTLWGGIIGDDGVEGIQIGQLGIGKAFTELQQWFKQLKERGIILTICSKNTEAIAKEPFISHPEMVLKLDDIAVFIANWETKVDNIRHIQSILNIGFDSMVFIDDNPFERNLVKENIPQIHAPDLPEDPSDYLNFLRALNLFETASFTSEDSERTHLYQEDAKRQVFKKSFLNEGEYLAGLAMTSKIESFNKFNIPRVAQLTVRSNQFNLRTKRYSEVEIEQIANSKKHTCMSFTLSDKFGDHGLIAVVILEMKNPNDLFIDTWLMSCRVLKRGMESFVLNEIVSIAKELGCEKVIGEYIPTPKNEIVSNHYKDLGFKAIDNFWHLDVKEYRKRKTYIN